MRRKPEVLAPAGDFLRLQYAFAYGADACYLADKRFGLRAYGRNFEADDLGEAVTYAHERGKKVYVACNISAREADFGELRGYARQLEAIRVDAAIVADPGIFSILRAEAPSLELHISTQANVCNSATCQFWYQLGARRIVLARELSLEEIKEIRANIPDDLGLECFVHGAMCMAHSGRCLLSAYFNQRSANRGACTQPCRWAYEQSPNGDDLYPQVQLQEKDRQVHEQLLAEQDQHGSYLLSSRDLCMIEAIPQLIEAGIDSFKIEGRMKGVHYVSVLSEAYRKAVDLCVEAQACGELHSPELAQKLSDLRTGLEVLSHRPYTQGFYFPEEADRSFIAHEKSYQKESDIVAKVYKLKVEHRAGLGYAFEQLNKLQVGEEVDLLQPGKAVQTVPVTQLFDAEGEAIEATPHPKMKFYLPLEDAPDAFSLLRRRGDKDQA